MNGIAHFTRRLLTVACAGTLLIIAVNATPAHAQGSTATPTTAAPSTSYKISGTNPDGSTYIGTLAVNPIAKNIAIGSAYQLTRTISGTTYKGLGVLHDGILSAVFGTDGCGLFVYSSPAELHGGGTGIWANIVDQKFGTEDRASSASSSNSDPFGGTYAVSGTNPDGSPYTGNVSLHEIGILVTWKWDTNGNPSGTGIWDANSVPTFTIGYQYKDTEKCSVVSYLMPTPSNYMLGIWTNVNENKGIGSEIAISNS